MITRSKTHKGAQSSALCTNPSVGGSCSSENTDSLQRNGDVLVIVTNLLVVYLITCVLYKINKYHPYHNCKLCIKFNLSHSLISFSTNINYEMIFLSHISIINSATSSCIYLITCKNCSIKYVGETRQTLRNRFSLHRSSIPNSQKINNSKILCDHYQKKVQSEITTTKCS